MNRSGIGITILFLSACTTQPHHRDALPLAPVNTESKSVQSAEPPVESDNPLPNTPEKLGEEARLISAPPLDNAPQTEQWPSETGMATYYASDMEGRLTSSGEPYDPRQLTAAHRTLPLGSQIRVTNLNNQQHIIVRINDRWGGGGNRIINLSKQAALHLNFGSAGMIPVRLDMESLPSDFTAAPDESIRRLPARQRSDATTHPRFRQCQNEANILGLTGSFFRNHVNACLSRSK